MDIIAAHKQGLIEQLDTEIADLAGRPGDHGQRAVVLHHLYDHSNGAHGWALIEARRTLKIARGLAALERKARSWRWSAATQREAIAALALLAETMGEEARTRFAGAYRSYRLSATTALRGEAESVLPTALLASLDACHEARRAGVLLDESARRELFAASDQFAGPTHEAQISTWFSSTRLRRSAEWLLGARSLAAETALGERKGWTWVENQVRCDPALPASFKANPAQHFYALQYALRERRRNRWREACDRDSDAAALAA